MSKGVVVGEKSHILGFQGVGFEIVEVSDGAKLASELGLLARDPDIVIVFLGGNDILQGIPLQTRITNITTIVQRIRQDGAAVILIDMGTGVLDAFGGALPALASQTSSTLVPGVLEGIFGVPGLMADAVHPNDAGHAIIADRIEPALRTALSAAGG